MRIDSPQDEALQDAAAPDVSGQVARELLLLQRELDTVQRLAKEQAQSHREQLITLVEATPVGMLLTEVEGGRVLAANDYVLRLLGYEREEIIGVVAPDLYYHAEERQSVIETIREHGEIHGYAMLSKRRDGSGVPIVLSSSRVLMDGVEVLVTGLDDVSELEAAQAKIQEHLRSLAHVSRLNTLGEMASGLAHELNQPLTAITNYANAAVRYMERGGNEAKLKSALQAIGTQAQRAGGVMTRMRGMASKSPVMPEPIHLNELISGVMELARYEIVDAKVNVRTQVASDLPRVDVDRIQIEQILLNLLRNALEALQVCPQHTRTVVVKATLAEAGAVRISVSDSGEPVCDEQIERAFEPFFSTKSENVYEKP